MTAQKKSIYPWTVFISIYVYLFIYLCLSSKKGVFHKRSRCSDLEAQRFWERDTAANETSGLLEWWPLSLHPSLRSLLENDDEYGNPHLYNLHRSRTFSQSPFSSYPIHMRSGKTLNLAVSTAERVCVWLSVSACVCVWWHTLQGLWSGNVVDNMLHTHLTGFRVSVDCSTPRLSHITQPASIKKTQICVHGNTQICFVSVYQFYALCQFLSPPLDNKRISEI